ncbi:hypothetical protein D9M71_538840 [compost metagenome]
MTLCQRWGGEKAQPALAQLLAVALDVQVAGHGAVGNDQVQALDRQVSQQPFELVFAAVDAQHILQLHGRCQQAVDDGLGHHVGHPHPEQDLLLRAGPQHGFQFAAQLEHLFGIDQRLAPGFGQLQLAPHALEQFQAIGLLEQADLPADGLRGQVQLFAGAGDAAGLGHGPEVVQLPIVEHRCFSGFVKTEV